MGTEMSYYKLFYARRSSWRILPRLDDKSLCHRKEEIPTKAPQIHNGELPKFKTQKEKQWVRRNVPLITKAKVSNVFTSCAYSFLNATMTLRYIPCRH